MWDGQAFWKATGFGKGTALAVPHWPAKTRALAPEVRNASCSANCLAPREVLGMFIAKVIGNVVATEKNTKFRGMKMLLIQPYISKEGKLVSSGSSVVAVDSIGAGVGECVLFTQGSSARLTPTTKDAPVDAVIVGIVDSVEVNGVSVEKP